jgi:phosphate transport system protein
VEDQIKRALAALDDEDVSAAREVIARDHLVNGLEVRADEESVNLIALRQPLGRDLRLIIALSKTVTDLERIGDEAERIARMVVHLYDTDNSPPSNRLFRDVLRLAELAEKMLRASLDAMARLDVQKAVEITQWDHELDGDFQYAMRNLTTFAMEDHRNIGHIIDVIFMLRALERIGDHAKNIGEYVIYLVRGKDIRHASTTELAQDVIVSAPAQS